MVNVPARGMSWSRLVIDRNPFFLLSAACMMAGCCVLNSALYTPAGHVGKLLILLGVINVYEVALIALGLVLIRRTGPAQRDGSMLLVIQTLFIADGVFSAGVISTIDPRWGWGVNAAILLLTTLKLAWVLKSLRLPAGGRLAIAVLLQVAVLLALPTIYKSIARERSASLPVLVAYAGWWTVGAVPVALTALLWSGLKERLSNARHKGLVIAYLLVPFISLLVHAYGAAWVYKIDLSGAHLAPVVLGLAVAVGAGVKWYPRSAVVWLQVVLIGTAMSLACMASDRLPEPGKELVFSIGLIKFNVAKLTFVASSLVVLWILWQYSLRHFVIGGVVVVLADTAILMPTPGWTAIDAWLRGGRNLLRRLIPTTTLAWGIVAVVASFILLGIGAIVSLRRRPEQPPPPPSAPPPAPTPAVAAPEELTESMHG